MGFIRSIQPAVPDRARATVILHHFIGEQEIAQVLREQDPFGCDDACPQNPAGHYPIRSAGDVVCAHCSKVIWR
jgi:hypothetical protein